MQECYFKNHLPKKLHILVFMMNQNTNLILKLVQVTEVHIMYNFYHQLKKDHLGFHFQVVLKKELFVGVKKLKQHYMNVNQKHAHQDLRFKLQLGLQCHYQVLVKLNVVNGVMQLINLQSETLMFPMFKLNSVNISIQELDQFNTVFLDQVTVMLKKQVQLMDFKIKIY